MALTKEQLESILDEKLKRSNEELKESLKVIGNDIKSELTSQIEDTSKKLQVLETTVKIQSNQILKLESEFKKKNVIVHNIPESELSNLNLKEMILNIFRSEVDSSFSMQNIDLAYRIGKLSSERVRPILVSLTTLNMKNLILTNKKTLQTKNISIAEDLPYGIRQIRKSLSPLIEQLKVEGHKVFFKGTSLIVNGALWDDDKVLQKINELKCIKSDEDISNKRNRSPESSTQFSNEPKKLVSTLGGDFASIQNTPKSTTNI